MKAWEICKEENIGKSYVDNEGLVWEVKGIGDKAIDLFLSEKMLSSTHTISIINNINFEEYKEPFIREGQKYYFIDGELGIYEVNYHGDTADKKLLSINNMYPFTEENKEEVRKEVELIRDRKKLQAEMEIFARENNTEKIDWNDCKKYKYYLSINYKRKIVDIESRSFIKEVNTIYFSKQEIAEKALEKFGARIKELYIDTEK